LLRKVPVGYFVSDTQKVMTALVLVMFGQT
jgi:hypothetical protein